MPRCLPPLDVPASPQGVCTMTAAFLHFFFLSSFCWVLTEAWQSYLAVIGRIRTRLVRKRFLCLGWGKRPAGLVPGWAGGEAPRAPPWNPPGLSDGETEAQWSKADLGVLVPSTWHPLTSQTVGSCQKGPIPVPIHGGWHRGDAGGGHCNATPLQLQPRLPFPGLPALVVAVSVGFTRTKGYGTAS